MDKLDRDILRMELILGLPIAQESLVSLPGIQDFIHYHFTRFISNFAHAFKDFSTAQIEDYNRRHSHQLKIILNDPLLKLEGVIVPIPKGMMQPYKTTISSLMNVLGTLRADQIEHDINSVVAMMEHPHVTAHQITAFSKADYQKAKEIIGGLYNSQGLTHSLAEKVFPRNEDLITTNNSLSQATSRYYPKVFLFNTLVKKIEEVHGDIQFEPKEKSQLVSALMGIAYRISIFATVLEHLQDMEHQFVQCLDIVTRITTRGLY